MTSDDLRGWRRWTAQGASVTDPSYVRDDPLPALVDAAQWLRHPRVPA
jgi:hypothetical protein